MVEFDERTANYGVLPVSWGTAQRLLHRPALNPWYRVLYGQAMWLRTAEAFAIAEKLVPLFARERQAIAESEISRTLASPASHEALLAEAERNAGIVVPSFVRPLFLQGLPELRGEPLVTELPTFKRGFFEELIRTELTRSETIDVASRMSRFGSFLLRKSSIDLSRLRILSAMNDTYREVLSAYTARYGNGPYRVPVFRNTFAAVMADVGSSPLKSRTLHLKLLQAAFDAAGANVDDTWDVETILSSVKLTLGIHANELVHQLEDFERAEAVAAAKLAPADIDPATSPSPPTIAKRQRVESLEERAERLAAREAVHQARVQALLEGPSLSDSGELREVIETPPPPADGKPGLSLRQLVVAFAIDIHAREQILETLPELDDAEKKALRRTLRRIAEGVRTFELGSNVKFANDYGVWEIRPQVTSNHRLCLQFAGGRAYLLNVANVKASHTRQRALFRAALKRWKTFLKDHH